MNTVTRDIAHETTHRGFPRHVVSSGSWRRDDLLALFAQADWMMRQSRDQLAGIAPQAMVGLLFYQNSTRTRVSFEAATSLLGARYVGFANAKTTRAGDFFQETLEDTVQVIGSYTDLLVLRHVDDDAAERAAAVSPVPVINAGTGESDHPTQGMLDTWMMNLRLGDLAGARIGLYGDPGCRAIRAILTMVSEFRPAEVAFLTPKGSPVSDEQRARLRSLGIRCTTVDSAAELLRRVDAVSMIPFELPDFHLSTSDEHRSGRVPDRVRMSRQLLESVGRDVLVLHTGPRGDELPPEVDELSNVRYFDGVRHGMFLRAALMNALWDSTGARLSAPAE